MNKVSLYIPVCNGSRYINRSLEAIFKQSIPFAEVIIVDDGSCDHSVTRARQFPVSVIEHHCNKGIATARNTGIQYCTHPFVASVDVDCVLDPYWLESCLTYFKDSIIAGVGGKLFECMHVRNADWWRSVNLIQHFGDGVREVPYLSGSNTIFRKADLVAVGLYNNYFMRHQEDIDISERLVRSGKKLMYISPAKVFHIKYDTWYTVMRSCWGFRHKDYAHTLRALIKDILREMKHALSIIFKSIIHARIRLLPLDCIYVFIQSYFCIKSYINKTTHFE